MSMDTGFLKGLDQSRVTGEHARIYSIAVSGHLCDGFAINIMSFVLPAIIPAFHLTSASAGFLASAVFFGMFVGAGGGGLLADRIGRRKTIILGILIFSVASLLCAAAPTYWTFWLTRLIAGVGLGAEVVLIYSYIVEFLPVKPRGTLTSSMVFFWMISSFIAAGIGIALIPHYGWRGMFVIAGLFGLVCTALWLSLPESIRFLLQNSRLAEAQKIMRRLGVFPLKEVAAKEASTSEKPRAKMPVSALWGNDYRARTLSVCAMQFLNGFVFFGIVVWLPTLLLEMGFSFVHSLLFTGIITGSGAIGSVVGGFLLDGWGRRPTLILFFTFGGLALVLWGFSTSAVAVIIIGAIGALFSFGVNGPIFTYASEIYPTELRATAVGISGASQRLGGIVAPYILGIFVGIHVSAHAIFAFVGALMILGGIIALFTAIETKRESLEQIAGSAVTVD